MHTINEPLSLVDIQKSYINVLLQELGYLQLTELSNQSVRKVCLGSILFLKNNVCFLPGSCRLIATNSSR